MPAPIDPDGDFFRIFSYGSLMHDAIDGGLTYEDCRILRDITTSSGKKLKKGDYFFSVYHILLEAEFHFCNWEEKDPQNRPGYWEPDSSSVFIPQAELAPYCHWEDSDEEYWKQHPNRRPAESIVIDNYRCPCGNDKCSTNEKSCWKCGAQIVRAK